MQQQELFKKLYQQSQNQTDLVASIQKEIDKYPNLNWFYFYGDKIENSPYKLKTFS